MAARLTDKQKQKIIADYLETGSYRATAKINSVADGTVKRIVLECGDIEQKIEDKKEQNTSDILAYMEKKRSIVCEILDKGLEALNSPDKLAEASPAQITTALGTLIDKWAMVGGPKDETTEDDLSRSLRELGEGGEMEWISVKECLPNYGDIVLIFEDSYWNQGVEVARFIKDEVFGNNETKYSWAAPQGPMSWFGQEVSHWMPLPEPPNGYQPELFERDLEQHAAESEALWQDFRTWMIERKVDPERLRFLFLRLWEEFLK